MAPKVRYVEENLKWRMVVIFGWLAPWATDAGWQALPAWIILIRWNVPVREHKRLTMVCLLGFFISVNTGDFSSNELRAVLKF